MAYQSGDNTTRAYDVDGNLTRLDDNAGTPRQTCVGSRGHPYQFARFSVCSMLRLLRRERELRRSGIGTNGEGERALRTIATASKRGARAALDAVHRHLLAWVVSGLGRRLLLGSAPGSARPG